MLAEALDLTGKKLGPPAATQTLDRLVGGAHFDVVHTPKTDFNAAQSLFRRHDKLTLVDSTITAYIRRRDLECLYSFDDGFDAVTDLTRLTTANNPFERGYTRLLLFPHWSGAIELFSYPPVITDWIGRDNEWSYHGGHRYFEEVLDTPCEIQRTDSAEYQYVYC